MIILSKIRGIFDQLKSTKLSFLIFLLLFFSFFLIEMIFFIPAYYEEEMRALQTLENSAKDILHAELHSLGGKPKPALAAQKLTEIIENNPQILGIQMSSTSGDLNFHAGEKPGFPMNQLPETTRLFLQKRMLQGNRYDVAFDEQTLGVPFDIQARLDSSQVGVELQQSQKRGMIENLLSALLYAVIAMIVIHYILLHPLSILRRKLSQALHDFEHADQYLLKITKRNELGDLIRPFNDLLKRIGSMQKTMKAHEAIQMLGIEERNKIFAEITHYNNITGLPNRALLLIKLKDYISQASLEGKRAVVFIIEIREYHEIANSLGQETANLFLKLIAKLLSESVPTDGIAAHIKTTRFAIARNNIDSTSQIMNLAQWILELFKQPFLIGGQDLLTPINIGIAVWPEDGNDTETLLTNANLALDRAKISGPNTYEFHEASMNEAVIVKRTLLLDMHYALERNEFVLYYQPQIDLKRDQIIGIEALIRWNHPEKGLIPPSTFIPLAEESELIVPIGEWALNTACLQGVQWQRAGFLDLIIAVNLSSIQFKQKNIVEAVNGALTKSNLSPHNLELEITESGIMNNLEASIATMKSLHRLGIMLSIDDFGTGYSSLSYLAQFPVQKLKIDQSFVKALEQKGEDKSLAPIIITLGHALNLKVIAEGVETEAQLEFLRKMDCDEVQGYYFSKPVPAEQCEELFKKFGAKTGEK